MTPLQYTLVSQEGETNIVVFHGGKMYPAHGSHPNFTKIVNGALVGDESIIELFDIAQTAATRFQRVSERVTIQSGRVYFDGDEVNDALAKQIVRFIDEDVDDWKPLVNFWEKLAANPNEHSRQQLYGFVDRNNITITEDGDLLLYKGVTHTDDPDVFRSMQSGTATVDGEVVTGTIPNKVGSIIEMPRSVVSHNPHAACHTGLHVATYRFATSYASVHNGTIIEVLVNPRDVVSVPYNDADKIRCCRYKVSRVSEGDHTQPVFREESEDMDYCPECGDDYDSCKCDELCICGKEELDCDFPICQLGGLCKCGKVMSACNCEGGCQDGACEQCDASSTDETPTSAQQTTTSTWPQSLTNLARRAGQHLNSDTDEQQS